MKRSKRRRRLYRRRWRKRRIMTTLSSNKKEEEEVERNRVGETGGERKLSSYLMLEMSSTESCFWRHSISLIPATVTALLKSWRRYGSCWEQLPMRERVARAEKRLYILYTLKKESYTPRNSLCCILTDVTCLNTSNKQELTTSEAAHFICTPLHSLSSSLVRPQLIIHVLIVLFRPQETA